MQLLAHESNELMAARRRSVLPPSVSRPLKRVGGELRRFRRTCEYGHRAQRGYSSRHQAQVGDETGKVCLVDRKGDCPRAGRQRSARRSRSGMHGEVVLSGLPSVVVRRRHASLEVALDEATQAVEQAVWRRVSRRRMKPLHGRSPRHV